MREQLAIEITAVINSQFGEGSAWTIDDLWDHGSFRNAVITKKSKEEVFNAILHHADRLIKNGKALLRPQGWDLRFWKDKENKELSIY